jgi:hypothetical protein
MSKPYKLKKQPDGYRKLKLVYVEPIPAKTVGVYALFFDNHFYIGKSIDVKRRVKVHLRKVNSLLGYTLYGNAPKPAGSYPIIVEHLIKNKYIDTMEAVVLYGASSDEDAIREEWAWLHFLQCHQFNKLCLNKFQFFER